MAAAVAVADAFLSAHRQLGASVVDSFGGRGFSLLLCGYVLSLYHSKSP